MRRVGQLRAAWGGVLLGAPSSVLRAAGAPSVDEGSVRIARLLGTRQLIQGTVALVRGSDRTRRLGMVADVLHAASALGLAVVSPRWRATACADGVLAVAFAATGRRARMDGNSVGRQHNVTSITGGS